MVTKTPLLLFAILCLVASPGCSLTILENPLVAPEAAKPIPKICGEYRKKGNAKGSLTHIKIEAASDEFPKGFLQITDLGRPQLEKLIIFLEPVGKYHILHAMINKDKTKNKTFLNDQQVWKKSDILGYYVIGLKIEDNSIQAAPMNHKFVQKQLDEKKISGRVESTGGDSKSKSIVITEPTKQLKKYFEKHIEKGLFSEPTDVWLRVE